MPWDQLANLRGAPGRDAYTKTLLAFTVPARGSSVTVSVGDTDWASIEQPVWVEGAGIMIVQAKTATQLTLLNPP